VTDFRYSTIAWMRVVTAPQETANSTFGDLVAVGSATTALPAFANVDPRRMFQLQARVIF
jgi:hypothetical protein